MKDDYQLTSTNTCNISLPKDPEKLKDYILIRMQKQYKALGKDFIRWIMKLYEENIFLESTELYDKTTKLSIEEQAELTIKNYEKDSSKFLTVARKIILDESIRQIHLIDDGNSYCHHDSITGQSYILINPTEISCIFNHEVEHAIEVFLKYKTNMLYYELGPIFYEMLFNEELYKLKGNLKKGDFEFRIDDTGYSLENIYYYFLIMLSFVEKNFNISTKEFYQTISTIKEMDSDSLDEYLREEIANDEIKDEMNYLFSFLKAIELREEAISSKQKQSEILEPYIKRKTFNFQIPQDGFKVYERYIGEMNQKVRKKIK